MVGDRYFRALRRGADGVALDLAVHTGAEVLHKGHRAERSAQGVIMRCRQNR